MKKVLVTDGENRSALAVTRSLGRTGYHVMVAGSHVNTLASVSKFCFKGVKVPDPFSDAVSYTDTIISLVKRHSVDAIIPLTEHSIYLLNNVRNSLPLLITAPLSTMALIADKYKLFQLAENLGVSVPVTFYLQGANELRDVIKRINKYPVVIKPALSSRLVDGNFLKGGIGYANSPEELEQIYEMTPVLKYPSLIQEKIIGPGTGLFTLYDKDRHIALFSHRRLREKPPSGGVSVVSESIPLDDEMVEAASRLLSAVGWQGVAMVEFKRDVRDGKPKLMEINGRFWGTLQLAITCGVDFPSLLMDYLQGKKICHQIGDYKVGHRMKWFFGTLDHLLIRLKNDDLDLNLPPNSPSKWGALKEFLKVWAPNTSFDVFDKSDPAPFFHEARLYLRQLVKSRG